MMKRVFVLVAVLGSLIMLGCAEGQTRNQSEEKDTTKAVNVIFMVGDGMGLSQVSSVFYFPGESKTNFTRFKQIGLINTSSAKEKITDSAAGATAFANGKRSFNGAIGVDVDSNEIENITELLSKYGYKTGVISTSSITHATPACFYAHVPSRRMEFEIAQQLIKSDIDFFAGGGIQFFRDSWADMNSKFIVDSTELKDSNYDINNRYGFLLADNGMPKMSEGRGEFLPKATTAALNYLSQSDSGFFLMIEGSQIDWGGHANDGQYIIDEMHDFDKAMGIAKDFAEKHGNTLLVITADHETGGFALSSHKTEDPNSVPYNNIKTTFSTGGHTSTLIPVFSYGPGSEFFDGIYNNYEIFHKMLESIGLNE